MKKGLIILLLICVNINGYSQEEKDRYSISNLTLNNGYSNFGTSFYGSDKLIFAMPAKKNFIINNIWKPNNQPFLDLYVGTIKEDGNLSNVEKFSSKINTKYVVRNRKKLWHGQVRLLAACWAHCSAPWGP